ncbi:Golgi resident protein GCP60 isoform X2 [Labrus bergylta]|uniref:Golgi resident protein GCP60 isoform X2 n=1 Tax=Labrus bergylta TaxID=56723 RepID=UPI0009B499C5|nr:Golgi resident protein GCP60 isoform X2 [Labrus bergylta]XP_060908049.1 Golgi resident protein GCP60 isoform X2 [Labrus mixtus]
MMATEVQSGDLDSATSSRLEVSIDGLTLSPDPEGEQVPVEEPDPSPEEPEADTPGAAAEGEDGESAKSAIESKWGFPLQELYGMGLKFFKDKDGKAFHPTYEEKLRLVALHKQVLLGPYNPDASPEVGFFDVLGNDRRKEWASLGNMEKEDAMVEFVKMLNKCCTLFAPYVISHKIEKEEQERRRKEEEERQRQEEEERERQRQEEERRRLEEEERLRREEEERRQADEERLRIEQQKQQIMAALNAQTAVQFQQYAAQQYPNNPEQQLGLIRQLQEQHYQQYMQQLYQVQLAQQQAALQKQQQADSMVQGTLESNCFNSGEPVAASAAGPLCAASPPAGEEVPTVNGGQSDSYSESMDREPEPEPAEEVSENGPLLDSPPVIAAPSMWTRPQIKDFKEKIRQDADSVITVGRGEVVTVRVPTHEEGSYLFWEFATDYYDIGFGVFFEWTDAASASVSVHVSESSDEDEEDEGDPPNEEEKAKKEAGKPQVDEIVPVYRRDCHEEVYAGSHQYPGRGVYLLKFDNSYSLWRSKSVYYRVYYTR